MTTLFEIHWIGTHAAHVKALRPLTAEDFRVEYQKPTVPTGQYASQQAPGPAFVSAHKAGEVNGHDQRQQESTTENDTLIAGLQEGFFLTYGLKPGFPKQNRGIP